MVLIPAGHFRGNLGFSSPTFPAFFLKLWLGELLGVSIYLLVSTLLDPNRESLPRASAGIPPPEMLEFLLVVCLIALALQLFIILVLKGCCCCCTRLLECIPGVQVSSVGLLVPDMLLAILLLVGSIEIEDDGTSDSTIATLA